MPRQELVAASQKIHGILIESLTIQVYCFGRPGFIGALKRLFKKTDFAASSKKLKVFIANLDFCLKEIKTMKNASEQEKEYALLLISYAESLITMIRKMDGVVKALLFRANGGKVTYGAYDDLVKDLDAAQFVCNQIGIELDAKFRELAKASGAPMRP